MPWGSSQAGMWSLVPCQRQWEVQDAPVSSCQQDREAAWQSLLPARCHEFTLFPPLPATRRKKDTSFPLFSVRALEEDLLRAVQRWQP